MRPCVKRRQFTVIQTKIGKCIKPNAFEFIDFHSKISFPTTDLSVTIPISPLIMPRCRLSVSRQANAVAHAHPLRTRPPHWWATRDWSISKMPPIRTCTSQVIYTHKPIVACTRNRISIQRRKSTSPKTVSAATHSIQMWQCRIRHSERFGKIDWNFCETNNFASVLAKTRMVAPAAPTFRPPRINHTNRSSYMWKLAKPIHPRPTNSGACIGCKCLPILAIIVFMKIIDRTSIRMWFMHLREIAAWLVAWARTNASMRYKWAAQVPMVYRRHVGHTVMFQSQSYNINTNLPRPTTYPHPIYENGIHIN